MLKIRIKKVYYFGSQFVKIRSKYLNDIVTNFGRKSILLNHLENQIVKNRAFSKKISVAVQKQSILYSVHLSILFRIVRKLPSNKTCGQNSYG